MRTKLEYLAKQTAKEDQCLTVIFMDWWCNQNFRVCKTKVKQSKQKLMVMFWERRWSWKSLKMISDRERSTNSTHWQQNGGAIHLQGNPGNKGLAKRKRLLQPPIWNKIILYILVLMWNFLRKKLSLILLFIMYCVKIHFRVKRGQPDTAMATVRARRCAPSKFSYIKIFPPALSAWQLTMALPQVKNREGAFP